MIPMSVQTTEGDVNINDISIGDTVYSYDSKKELEVMEIVDLTKEDVYKVTYTDGREDYYQESELIYIGYGVIPIKSLIDDRRHGMHGSIKQYQISYGTSYNPHVRRSDPYISGALCIYGNAKDEFINLPSDCTAANSFFINKYQAFYEWKIGSNATYFSRNGDINNKLISWKDFFHNKTCHDIIKEYKRASINDRWEFIRGVFDIGYKSEAFPDSCSIAHSDEDKLKIVQEILWSLGVLSKTDYDPSLQLGKGREYRLDILSPSFDNYPGFFYNIDSIERMIRNQSRLLNPKFKLQIGKIEKYNSAFSRRLIFNQRNSVYLTSNFLPRVGM